MSVKEVIDRAIDTVKEALTGDKEESIHERRGADPHATYEQSRPFVNKDEPSGFANPVESGAKKPSEDVAGMANPYRELSDVQKGCSNCCSGEVHTRAGDDPHATYQQSRPFVNKEEPKAFANPCESGAKKPSEHTQGAPMPQSGQWS